MEDLIMNITPYPAFNVSFSLTIVVFLPLMSVIAVIEVIKLIKQA